MLSLSGEEEDLVITSTKRTESRDLVIPGCLRSLAKTRKKAATHDLKQQLIIRIDMGMAW